MAGLATVGVAALGVPTGHADSATAPADAPAIPRGEPRPTPLGLPPRPTPTFVATVPSQPIDTVPPGSCLQLYPSKEAAAYPVIDCASPHLAQLLTKGVLPQPAGSPFPGTAALDAQVTDLCEAPGLLDWHWVAVWGEDVMVDLRYPETAERWEAGDRSYYCFVYTFSRHELTGSAMPGDG